MGWAQRDNELIIAPKTYFEKGEIHIPKLHDFGFKMLVFGGVP